MKNRIMIFTLVSITLFGLSIAATAAQSQIINLVANDSLEINCDGDQLNISFESDTKAIAECSPGDVTPDPTDEPGTVFDDWLDTGANNSLAENDALFDVTDVNGNQVLGTSSSLTNIHSHFVGADSHTMSNYEYTGQMVMTTANGGIGLTFFSQYPQSDAYYRLRRYNNNSFHISPHGTEITGGTTDTGLVPEPFIWYRFRIQVEDTGTQTEIRAKVWPATGSEPGDWQIDAFDDSSTRLTAGTIGVWSMSGGSKYWHELATNPLSPSDEPDEPEPTDTPEPQPTQPVDDPDSEEHDVTQWHPPAEGHHHGFNVMDTEFADLWLEQTGQEIAYPWLSSPIENLFPFSNGKHEGFQGLHEADTGCRQFDENSGSVGSNCVKSYFSMVHSIGNVHAVHTRIHSFALAAKICTGPDGNEPCGYVFTGGHQDYGVLHNRYKTDICELSSDPENYPYDTNQGINQPPYRTGQRTTLFTPKPGGRVLNPQFWVSLGPNPIYHQYYPHQPNHIAGLAWSSNDAWSYINGDPDLCSIASEGVAICPEGDCEFNHTEFQVFSIRITNLPTERPFDGFTDVNGHVDPACTEASATCVPLVITEDVPQGMAFLNTSVFLGGGDAPIQEFDDGAVLKAPGY